MTRWLDGKIGSLDSETAALIGRYARWHLLRHLRGLAERAIATLTPDQFERYLAEYPGGRTSQQGFLSWLHQKTRTNPAVTITRRPTTFPEVIVSDDDRWEQVSLLLRDDTIPRYARIGGLFMLLFAQPLETIVAMRADQVTIDDGRVLVTFDTLPIEMPPGLDDLIRQHLTRPAAPSIASTDHGWLFPGRNPGHHLVRQVFRSCLAARGIRPSHSRAAALFALAGQVPAPVLGELIGIADKTATKWAALAARDWSGYISDRAR